MLFRSVLAMRPLSFLPSSDLQTWENQELEVLLTHFDSNPADGEGKFLDSEAARHEWSLVKHLVLQEKYPRDCGPWELFEHHLQVSKGFIS